MTTEPIPMQKIPEHLRGGVLRYINYGVKPGHFLTAVLSSDLTESFARADDESCAALHEIIKFLYNHAPGDCWGNPAKVHEWTLRGGFGEERFVEEVLEMEGKQQ